VQARENDAAQGDGSEHDAEQGAPGTDHLIERERQREATDERGDLREVRGPTTQHGSTQRRRDSHSVLEPSTQSPGTQRDVPGVVDTDKHEQHTARADAEAERRERGDGACRQPRRPHESIADAAQRAAERCPEALDTRGRFAVQLRPRERSTAELIWPDPNDALYRQAPGRFASELHDRLSSPLYAFTFVLLAVAALGHAQTTRQNRNQAAVTAFVLAVGCRIGGIVTTNAAAVRASAIPLMYAVPLLAGLAAAVAIGWHAYPHRPSPLLAAVTRPWRTLAGHLVGWLRPGAVAAASRGRS